MTIGTQNALQWLWLAQEGHRRLQDAVVISNSPLRIQWNGALDPWQRIMLEAQMRLRWRSRGRFPETHRWLWTDRSLQQASDWNSARVKAAWFPVALPVVDGCCGAGADLVALAAHHRVLGIDRDPMMVGLAQANLAAHQRLGAGCVGPLPECIGDLSNTGIHIDPDRRTGDLQLNGKRNVRTTCGEAFSPPLSVAMELGLSARAAIIKLAPATRLAAGTFSKESFAQWGRCWLGSGGECPQQLLLRGELHLRIPHGLVGAVLCGENGDYELFCDSPDNCASATNKPLRYVYDPHACLYASKLAGAWAATHSILALPHVGGFFTSDHRLETPWAQVFRVLDHFSFDDRRLRAWLRKHNVGPLEVKTRHVALDANQLQRRYSQTEGRASVCLLTSFGKSVHAILAER